MWSAARVGRQMKENKLVTWEMFQKYHEQLMDYITSRDDLTVDGSSEYNCLKISLIIYPAAFSLPPASSAPPQVSSATWTSS